MQITRTSLYSGITRTRDIDVTPDQYAEWERGALIHRVMSHLSDSDREFIISGMTDEEWDDLCDYEPDEYSEEA